MLATNGNEEWAARVRKLFDASPFGRGCKAYPKRDLWHLRTDVFNLVSRHTGPHEAQARLARLNRKLGVPDTGASPGRNFAASTESELLGRLSRAWGDMRPQAADTGAAPLQPIHTPSWAPRAAKPG